MTALVIGTMTFMKAKFKEERATAKVCRAMPSIAIVHYMRGGAPIVNSKPAPGSRCYGVSITTIAAAG